jgi:hypothetical protein
VYKTDMMIKANAGSGNLIYAKIDNIKGLIKEKDTESLSKILEMSPQQASQVKEIKIIPVDPKTQVTKNYEWFKLVKDTIITNHVTFQEYYKRFSEADLPLQKLSIIAATPEVALEVANKIPDWIQNTQYQIIQQQLRQQLYFKREKILHNLAQIDTMRKYRFEIDRVKAANTSAVTDLNLTNNSDRDESINYYDVEMLKMSDELLKELDFINEQISYVDQLVEVTLPPGYPVVYESITDRGWFRYALYGFLLALLVISGIRFNAYLNRYEEEINA